MHTPKPMSDPCVGCEKYAACTAPADYKCPRFLSLFVESWDETTAFLRKLLGLCP